MCKRKKPDGTSLQMAVSAVKPSTSLISTIPALILPSWTNIVHVYHTMPNELFYQFLSFVGRLYGKSQ